MFYVYTLTDPRNGAVFYVGKGKRDRLNHHTREVKAGRTGCNLGKESRIRSILTDGMEPVASIVAKFSIEAEAFQHERHLIATTIGLTHISAGGTGWSVRPEIQAKREQKLADYRYHKSMIFFRRWLRVVTTWPGVTFPGIQNGDEQAEYLVQYASQCVAEWERRHPRLAAQIA
jgi:hypothetical protein